MDQRFRRAACRTWGGIDTLTRVIGTILPYLRLGCTLVLLPDRKRLSAKLFEEAAARSGNFLALVLPLKNGSDEYLIPAKSLQKLVGGQVRATALARYLKDFGLLKVSETKDNYYVIEGAFLAARSWPPLKKWSGWLCQTNAN